MDIKEQIKQKIDEIFPQIVAFRRDLHAHPELSGQEDRTSRRIAEELEKLGIEPHVTPEKAVFGAVTGKGPVSGNNRSHSLRATRRRWNVNLQKRKVEIDGEVVVIRISNRAYRTLKKSTKAAK